MTLEHDTINQLIIDNADLHLLINEAIWELDSSERPDDERVLNALKILNKVPQPSDSIRGVMDWRMDQGDNNQ